MHFNTVPANLPRILVAGLPKEELSFFDDVLFGPTFELEFMDAVENIPAQLNSRFFEMIMIDLTAPGASGLIEIVARQNPEVIVVVIGAENDFASVTGALREHKAYDFILKPLRAADLTEVINRSLKMAHLRGIGLSFLESEQRYYESLLETFDWKREIRARHSNRFDVPMLLELNRILFQGEGTGVLLNALQLMLATAREAGEGIAVDPEIFKLIKDSTTDLGRLSTCISSAVEVLGRKRHVQDRASLQEVCDFSLELAREIGPVLQKNNRRLVVGPVCRADLSLTIPWEASSFRTILLELLINAAKYSRPGDVVFLLFAFTASHFEIKIINPAYSDDRLRTLDEESEALVFSPFFRLARGEADVYQEEEFGFGLGLTVVRKLVELHQAHVSIARIKNYMRTDQFNDICATVRFPVGQAAGTGDASAPEQAGEKKLARVG